MMKSAALTLTVVAFLMVQVGAMSDEAQKNYQDLISQCRKNFPISEENVKGLHSTGSLSDESDEQAMCYVNCVMEGMELVKDGKFQAEEQKKVAESVLAGVKKSDGTLHDIVQVKKDIDDCAKLSGKTACQTNYMITQCIEKKRRESGISNPN